MLQFLKRVFRTKAVRLAPARPALEVLERREVLNAALPGASPWGVHDTQGGGAGAIIINYRPTTEATSYKLAPGGTTVAGWSPDGRPVLGGNPFASYSPDGDRSLKQRSAQDAFWPAGSAVGNPGLGSNPFASFSPDGDRPAATAVKMETTHDLFWPAH
jgi:hypothetical protein